MTNANKKQASRLTRFEVLLSACQRIGLYDYPHCTDGSYHD